MKLEQFVEYIMGATLDDLGSLVERGEVEGERVSGHNMAVGTAASTLDAEKWVDAFAAVVANEGADARAQGAKALTLLRMVTTMYAASRGSAADVDAAARLVWRLVGDGSRGEREMRTREARWVGAPAGIALWDGGSDDAGRRVWVGGWDSVLGAAAAQMVAADWEADDE